MEIVLRVMTIVAPVFVLAAIGWVWVRARLAYDLAFVTRLAMQLGMPCLLFVSLARAEVDPAALGDLALASVIGYFAVGVLSLALCVLLGVNLRALLSPLIFGNTGNLGLPIAFFAYGDEGLAYALVVFAVMAVINFTLGVWMVSGEGSREMLRQPVVYGAALGLGAMVWQVQPPVWVMNAMALTGQMAIPLMLITLGVALARLTPRDVGVAILLSVLKLAIGLAVGFGIVRAMGLGQGPAAGAFVLQLVMPVAVTSYLLATRYDAEPQAVAGLVVVSTLISVPAIPVVLALLL